MQALVLTPTRELCIQVTQALRAYAQRKGVDVVAVFGGAPIRTQQAQLKAGGHIVVGTVGRVLDLINRRSLVLHSCRFVVLDEADEMLDLGFLEDVEKILRLTPNSRQTALFSATMPPPIRELADNYLYDPEHVKVKSATLTVDSVEQFQVDVKTADKPDKLVEVLEAEKPDQAIVFARTKIRTDQLYKKLRDRGMNVKALHGDMTQGSRDGVMLGFKGGRVPILVATDVAARGLDISTVTHVINFDVPRSPDVYVHRIGRTGRVGRSGRAITFVEPKQEKELLGDREARRHRDLAVDAGRAHRRRRRRSRREAQAPHEAAAHAQRRRALREAHRQRRALGGHRGRRSRRRRDEGRVLDGESVRDVKVLEHFAFLSVPAADAERIAIAVDGERVRRPPHPRGAREGLGLQPRPQPCGRLRVTLFYVALLLRDREAANGAAPPPSGNGASAVVPDFACEACGAGMVRGQDWCLECGTAARGRLGAKAGWRAAFTIVALTLLLVSGAGIAGYAALTSDSERTAAAPRRATAPRSRRRRRPVPTRASPRRASPACPARPPPRSRPATPAPASRRRLRRARRSCRS